MKYLESFNGQLRFFRETHKFSYQDIASLCNVDASVAEAWENKSPRVYPSLENLLDVCFKTGASLEYFIDIPQTRELPQLELPGIAPEQPVDDLAETLEELDKTLSNSLPKDEELELLKRFRKSDPQNKELILQLMGMQVAT